jgi:hypothetical protein
MHFADAWSNYQIFGDICVTQYDITYVLDVQYSSVTLCYQQFMNFGTVLATNCHTNITI